jgi:hypothetical protein
MNYIDLWDIHDAAFIARPECNACESQIGEGMDSQCIQLEAMNHRACPFVNSVISDAEAILGCENKALIIDFGCEIMDLELDDFYKDSISIGAFSLFVSQNKEIFKDKITGFFVNRLSNENNYRRVLLD